MTATQNRNNVHVLQVKNCPVHGLKSMLAELSTSGIKQGGPLPAGLGGGDTLTVVAITVGTGRRFKVSQFGGRRMSDRGHTSSGWS